VNPIRNSSLSLNINRNTIISIDTHNHSPLPYIPQHPLPHLPSISTNELTNSSSKYINSNITSSSTSSSTNTNTNTNSSSGSDIGSSSGNVIGRLTYTFYYSSNRILNVDEVVKIKKIYDSHWVKVERNPREYFIIPLLVLEAPFEEIRRLKIYSQKYRSKESTTEEELEINDRVEPTPEYLYHCAYISFKDYQKMSYNGRWERKIKTLHHVLPKDSSTITSTTSTTTNNNNNYINNNNNTNVISSSSASSSFSFSSINASVTGSTTSMPVTPYKLKTSINIPQQNNQLPRYQQQKCQRKFIPKVDLETFLFLDHDDAHQYTNHTTLKINHPPLTNLSGLSKINNEEDHTYLHPFSDSSLDGINMTSSSQDDLVIRENSRTRILNSEEKEKDDEIKKEIKKKEEKKEKKEKEKANSEKYYNYKSISDHGAITTTTLQSFKKLEESKKKMKKKRKNRGKEKVSTHEKKKSFINNGNNDNDNDYVNENENVNENRNGNGNGNVNRNRNINDISFDEEEEEEEEKNIHLTTYPKSFNFSTLKSQRPFEVEEDTYNNGNDEDDDEEQEIGKEIEKKIEIKTKIKTKKEEEEEDDDIILDLNPRAFIKDKNSMEKPLLLLKPMSQFRKER
jgi:hypothetical protein